MRTHLNILALLYLLTSIGEVLAGLALIGIASAGGLLTGDVFLFSLIAGLGSIFGFFLIAIGLPGLILAYGLWRLHWWARPLGFVLGVLNLLNPPIGLLLGIYTIWVLLKDEARVLLERGPTPVTRPGPAV
jgi:hypothetical protein